MPPPFGKGFTARTESFHRKGAKAAKFLKLNFPVLFAFFAPSRFTDFAV